jgi:hypothetical protein
MSRNRSHDAGTVLARVGTAAAPARSLLTGLLTGLLLTGLLLAGCTNRPSADPTPPSAESSAGVSRPPASTAGQPTSPAQTPSPATTGASMPSDVLTLTGVVTSTAVEGGCFGLRTDAKTYELLGGDRSVLTVGARVRVTGRVRTDVATICQIGTPFEVISAERI